MLKNNIQTGLPQRRRGAEDFAVPTAPASPELDQRASIPDSKHTFGTWTTKQSGRACFSARGRLRGAENDCIEKDRHACAETAKGDAEKKHQDRSPAEAQGRRENRIAIALLRFHAFTHARFNASSLHRFHAFTLPRFSPSPNCGIIAPCKSRKSPSSGS
jgi:hypothetical protein